MEQKRIPKNSKSIEDLQFKDCQASWMWCVLMEKVNYWADSKSYWYNFSILKIDFKLFNWIFMLALQILYVVFAVSLSYIRDWNSNWKSYNLHLQIPKIMNHEQFVKIQEHWHNISVVNWIKAGNKGTKVKIKTNF